MRFEGHALRFPFHTLLSDGAMHPMDLVQRMKAAGHRALAITDHIGLDDAATLLPQLTRACAAATDALDMLVIPGVEITCIPPPRIASVAKAARKLGAVIVVVHGETLLEGATPKGTNAAAVRAAGVDILAHPGLIALKDARAAAENGVFLEISGKAGHSLSNGHVARTAREAGASVLVDSDTHMPEQILTEARARQVAAGAGLDATEIEAAIVQAPRALLKRHDLR